MVAGRRVGAIAAHELHHDAGQARRLVAELAEQLDPDVEQQRLVAALAGVLERLDRSLDALLLGETDEVERTVVRLDQLVERVAREHDPDEVRVELAVPSLVVSLDAVKVERIVDNLLANALAHAPPGTRVRVEGSFESGTVTLTVQDDGPGIPAEIAQRLDRLPADVEQPHGLDVVARFARAHGGQVWAGPGPGARVHVELPTSRRDQTGRR